MSVAQLFTEVVHFLAHEAKVDEVGHETTEREEVICDEDITDETMTCIEVERDQLTGSCSEIYCSAQV